MTVRHPCPFSDAIMPVLRRMLDEYCPHEPGTTSLVLDPFAGTGRIHEFRPTYQTIGIEIEPEWADLHPNTIVGDATKLPAGWTDLFDAVVTSPTYGNRMADHHEAKDSSRRITYRHVLGRMPSDGSSAVLQFGRAYMELHARAWAEAHRVLRPGGLLVLNVSDFIRHGERIDVVGWHMTELSALGFVLFEDVAVETPRMGFGANAKLRVQHEHVIALRKPNPTTEVPAQ